MSNSATKSKVALIFGITGQTGSYLADHLISLDYTVHGVIRRSSNFNTQRLEHIFPLIRDTLHYGDVLDPISVLQIITAVQPDEIYNLAAQSHVKESFAIPYYTSQVDALGTLNILEGIRISNLTSKVKFYQANTSEMFGGCKQDYTPEQWERIQKTGYIETDRMFPKSPYAVAKLYSHHLVSVYRESYGMYAVSGICFNHESERRDPRFLPRKVSKTVARIYGGKEKTLVLGNLDACRDWGYAQDYAEAIWKVLQLEKPTDMIIATGKTHTVRYLVEVAFKAIGVEITWKGEGENEKGYDKDNNVVVEVSSRYYRPNEVHFLKGDASLAKRLLNWEQKISFEEMIKSMVMHDIAVEMPHINQSSLCAALLTR